MDSTQLSNKFQRRIEDFSIQLAMLCDENGLSVEEGRLLADEVSQALEFTAEDRQWQEGVPGATP